MNKTAGLSNLIKREIEICHELAGVLNEVLQHRRGSVWGEEQVSALNIFFSRLHELNREIDLIDPKFKSGQEENGILVLTQELETQMLSLKPLLAQFQARLTGGKQAISARLKELLAGKDIKRYQNGTPVALRSSGLMG